MDLDPDRQLALAYVPASRRPAVEALWRLDATLGAILATGSEPLISQMRLAWWREALERLDREPPPAEPLRQALAAYVLPTVRGAELAAMEDGWLVLLSDESLSEAELADYAERRGGLLFELTARLLGGPDFPVRTAGTRWALADLARRSRRPEEVRSPPVESKTNWPSRLRPLGMLAMLARRDLERIRRRQERQGSPSRMMRMIWHRISGY